MAPLDPMSPAQKGYIESLMARKIAPGSEQHSAALERMPTLNKATASKWIDKLKGMPDLPGAAPYQGRTIAMKTTRSNDPSEKPQWVLSTPFGDVPPGHYAIDTSDTSAANETTFYFIWVGENENAWAVFLEHGPDQTKLARNTVNPLFEVIAKNPQRYLEAYGKLIGKCGVCGLRLTNDESRARGIGPICAGKWGY